MVKTALITGGASGIGKACVEKMAREGYGVVIADVNLAGAEALAAQLTAEGLSAMAVHMDVGSEEEVEAGFDKMMEAYGSCDLVMSNAGVQIVHPFDEYPFSDWKKMMSIHADGAFLVSRAAFRRMKASGKGGRIVFTGSVQSFVGSKLKEPSTSSSTAWQVWPRPSRGRALNTASTPIPSAPASSKRRWWKSRSPNRRGIWVSRRKKW